MTYNRSKKYGEKYYQALIEKISSLPSEELREELKTWIGEKI